MLPSAETLRQLLRYEPETGFLYWKERDPSGFDNPDYARRWNGRYAGKRAFTALRTGGYPAGRLLKRNYAAHRLIWAMMTGEWPEFVDHINGVRTDNRWSNLRAVDRAANNRNAALRRDSTSGVTGVSWDRNRRKWHAHIKKDGRHTAVGFFEHIEDAIRARKAAERELGYHPNHGRTPDANARAA